MSFIESAFTAQMITNRHADLNLRCSYFSSQSWDKKSYLNQKLFEMENV